jgi:hypothetical protein
MLRLVGGATNHVTFPQCFNLRGNAGRNILTGPGTSSLDFSLFKNNPIKRISENFNVQFRAEVFNILNRANFAAPVAPDNVTIFDSSGASVAGAGLLTSTTTTRARDSICFQTDLVTEHFVIAPHEARLSLALPEL